MNCNDSPELAYLNFFLLSSKYNILFLYILIHIVFLLVYSSKVKGWECLTVKHCDFFISLISFSKLIFNESCGNLHGQKDLGGWKNDSGVKSTAALLKDPCLVPCHMAHSGLWLHSRGFHALFWLPLAPTYPHTCGMHTERCTYIYINIRTKGFRGLLVLLQPYQPCVFSF